MRCLRFVVVFLLFAVLPVAAYDGNWTLPGRKAATETTCKACRGEKATALPTWQYGYPFAAFTGRYIDSTATANQQNVGMRTVRARRVRLNRDGQRIYVGLGEAVGVYKLDEFFTTALQRTMETPASLATGTALGDRDGSPVEAISVPYQFFYAECGLSEWRYEGIDIQETLLDFDGDDRKYLYIGSKFGWGMARENGLVRGHMDNMFQLRPAIEADSVFSLKVGAFRYYAVVSQNTASAGKMLLYDVTVHDAEGKVVPEEVDFRDKTDDKPNDKYGIAEWAKSDGLQRLALLNTDGHVRIYDYQNFIDDTAPLADYEPPPGRKFVGVSMDDEGAIWFTSTHQQQVTSNVLYRAVWNPLFRRYDLMEFEDAYGGDFSPGHLSTGGEWVAVGGRSALDTFEFGGEMRLFKVVNGVPVRVPDYDFFRNYYDVAPPGFTAPTICYPSHIGLRGLQIVKHGLKTYLMYSTTGLGDVYELANSDTRIATTVTLQTETSSNAVRLIATVNAAAMGATSMSGVVSFTRDGEALASATISATNNPLTYIVDLPRTDLNSAATLTVTYEGDELYKSAGPSTLLYVPPIPAPASFNAIATTSTSVQLTWDNVPGRGDYQVQRKSSGSDWMPIATTNNASFVDSSVTANQVYLYRVRVAAVGSFGLFSTTDIASTYTFTDDPLTAGVAIKAAHINELRSAINAARALAGLPAFTFTDATLARSTIIRAIHITELRAADEQLHTALGLAALLPATPFSRNDLDILRDGIR